MPGWKLADSPLPLYARLVDRFCARLPEARLYVGCVSVVDLLAVSEAVLEVPEELGLGCPPDFDLHSSHYRATRGRVR